MTNIVFEYLDAQIILIDKIEHIISILHPGFPHRGVIQAPNLMYHHDIETGELHQEIVAEIDTYQTLDKSIYVIIPIEYFDMTDKQLIATGAFLF